MGFEARLGDRPLLKVVGITAASLVVGLPFRDRENTKRILGAAIGRKVDSTHCVEPAFPEFPYDAIVVPGGGLQMENGEWVPSDRAKFRLEDATDSYLEGLAPHIILIDGIAGSEEQEVANLRYLKGEFAKREEELPEGVVIQVKWPSSFNTRTNMKELAELALEHSFRRVVIATNGFHETRATLFACREGLGATSRNAEEEVLKRDPARESEVRQIFSTRRARILAFKDKAEVAMSIWDPDGRTQTLARKSMLFCLDTKKSLARV